ncbi:hypothetical protein [Chamaesiphon polymorphus]|uniref:Uncharacterized protein n=1 Tax=Chamaesiphon polymorphus CCALA 037 TaxID=2107692 RepID=A0A2T1GCF2_9CYAN|nr:hypothetical protein [Chamaesiphon polymorphus]PSB55077.1 hypothetical protein C7B77_16165 [Chamaesiphon polymorphus CCALA 037]
MKSISGLAIIAITMGLNTAPSFAASQSSSNSTTVMHSIEELNLSNRPSKSATEASGNLIVRDVFSIFRQQQQRQDRLNQQQQQQQNRDQQRQDRIDRQNQQRQDRIDLQNQQFQERREIRELNAKRQEQIDLARKEASERERVEADRRYRYFLSLSPAAQQRYITEQRILQDRQNDRSAKIVGLMIEAIISR